MGTLYIALFATQVALLGIASPALLGFVQLVAGSFSPRVASSALRDRLSIALLLFMFVPLVPAAFGAVVISIDVHDGARRPAQLSGTVIVSMALAVMSLPALYLLLRRVATYADPARVPALPAAALDGDELADRAVAMLGDDTPPTSGLDDGSGLSEVDTANVVDNWGRLMSAARERASVRREMLRTVRANAESSARDPLQPLLELAQRSVGEDRLLCRENPGTLGTEILKALESIQRISPSRRRNVVNWHFDMC